MLRAQNCGQNCYTIELTSVQLRLFSTACATALSASAIIYILQSSEGSDAKEQARNNLSYSDFFEPP